MEPLASPCIQIYHQEINVQMLIPQNAHQIKIDKGFFFFPAANIILFSTNKWRTSHISKTSLVAVRYKLPESPASEKFLSSKKPLIVCVAESFEKSKISFLLNLKEIIMFFIDLLG